MVDRDAARAQQIARALMLELNTHDLGECGCIGSLADCDIARERIIVAVIAQALADVRAEMLASYLREIGARGGTAAGKSMSSAKRKARAVKAGQASAIARTKKARPAHARREEQP